MQKSYMQVINEDLSEYLVRYTKVPHSNCHYMYYFDITNATREIKEVFIGLTKQYVCWKFRASSTKLSYTTKSTVLKDIFDTERVKERNATLREVDDIPQDSIVLRDMFNKKESIEDIVIHIDNPQFKQEYQGEFKQKGNEMNKDKFNVNFSINISVGGKQITLTDPVKPDDALACVLTLQERYNFLVDQLTGLKALTPLDGEVDNISIDKVTSVLTDEMEEIKEIINYINENIEEV